MIVTFGSSKGGAGKSTLCTNMLVQHLDQNPDTALVDADPQKSASCWSAVRDSRSRAPGVLTFEKTGSDLGTHVIRLNEKYPSVFIDVAGRMSSEFKAALVVSQLLVLPLRPSNFDAWSFADDIEVITNARIYNPNLKVLIVFNAISTNPRAGASEVREIEHYLEQFAEYNLLLAASRIHSRSGYVKAVGEGGSVTELTGSLTSDSTEKAKAEIANLYSEILNLSGGNPS